MSIRLNTPEFRVAFPSVGRPKHNTLNGKEEYSVVALFPKDADMTVLANAAQEALIAKFGADRNKWPGDINKYKSPFRDQGDREQIDKITGARTLYEGYERGAFYINLKSTKQPDVVNGRLEKIIDSNEFYGGCWAIASITAYAYDEAGNRGVAFGLGNIQKVRDDTNFGGSTKATDDFVPVAMPDATNMVSGMHQPMTAQPVQPQYQPMQTQMTPPAQHQPMPTHQPVQTQMPMQPMTHQPVQTQQPAQPAQTVGQPMPPMMPQQTAQPMHQTHPMHQATPMQTMTHPMTPQPTMGTPGNVFS